MTRVPPIGDIKEAREKFEELVSQFRWEPAGEHDGVELCWSLYRNRIDPAHIVDDIMFDFGYWMRIKDYGKQMTFSSGDYVYFCDYKIIESRGKGKDPTILLRRIKWDAIEFVGGSDILFK